MKDCYKIAICDDDEIMLQNIFEYIKTEFTSMSYEYSIIKYSDVKKMLADIKIYEFDIYFLDIDMPNINGLEASHSIKLNNPESVIIFISGMDEMVYESLKVRPLRFIRKLTLEKEISEAVKAAVNEISSISYKITVEVNKQKIKIDIRNILYIESIRNYIYVNTTNSKRSKYRGSINQREKELNEYGFIRTHVGYLVNQRYIRRVNKNSITLVNDEEIPVSRANLKTVEKKFIEGI
ncbi:response regulator transcription factor [Sedimentibacter hydroxybenzoicus DSM 7310]|uniref:Response regulator transcription factor n=1 Tax=Sedimentibacter hydroxybenzoicus DSM 7310 TaxID=1123245 RepID=A0A974BMI2_SEDHY|nr:LytTR family DNA-binding domain-containing protein [Sedimentibacter hydroxybenzoicus]NYB75556.1 response regulator transcription factor [Sedimentibacter hydroxybenzoicus DSM 7310]